MFSKETRTIIIVLFAIAAVVIVVGGGHALGDFASALGVSVETSLLP